MCIVLESCQVTLCMLCIIIVQLTFYHHHKPFRIHGFGYFEVIGLEHNLVFQLENKIIVIILVKALISTKCTYQPYSRRRMQLGNTCLNYKARTTKLHSFPRMYLIDTFDMNRCFSKNSSFYLTYLIDSPAPSNYFFVQLGFLS